MADINFVNPLHHPDFILLLTRMSLVLFAGLFAGLLSFNWNIQKFTSDPVGKRILSWIGILILSLIGLTCGRVPGMVLLLTILLFAIREAAHKMKLPVSYVDAIMILAFLSVIVTNYYLAFFYALPLIYFVVFCLLASLHSKDVEQLHYAADSLFASVWIIFGGCHIILLALLNNSLDQSTMIIVPLLLAVALSDVGGMLIAKWRKTKGRDVWASFLGNVVAVALSIAILQPVVEGYISVMGWIIAGMLISFFGMTYGLGSTLLERAPTAKGAVQTNIRSGLSVIDSLIQSTIIFYYYLLIIMS